MRIQNTPFGSNPFKRGVAIITSALFLFTGLFSYAPTAFAKPNNLKVLGGNPSGLHRLDRDREIRIPPELGLIDESFRGNSGKTILFIQDAHDSLEAQENIAKIINHLVTNDGVKTVFEEGYEGPVPTDKYFGFIKDPKIKEKVAYFLMDHLRVGGAEYAHINRTKDFILVGADSLKLHKENVDQYRFAASKKDAITKDLKALKKELKSLVDSRFPRPLKEWLKTKSQFDTKKLDLFTYLGRTMPLLGEHGAEKGLGLISFILEAIRSNDPVVIEKAKHIDAREVFNELKKLEQAVAETCLHDTADKQLFEYYKILSLLNRLNELQVSQEEYESVKASLKAFDTDSFARFIFNQTPKTLILSKIWERNIKDAIRFYEIAKARDSAVNSSLDSFLKSEDMTTAVMVFGGFHKEAIKRIFENKGMNYLVVSPRITKPSLRHEEFYKHLMTAGHHDFEIPFLLARATRAFPLVAESEPMVRAEVRAIYNTLIAHPDIDPAILGGYLPEMNEKLETSRSAPPGDQDGSPTKSVTDTSGIVADVPISRAGVRSEEMDKKIPLLKYWVRYPGRILNDLIQATGLIIDRTLIFFLTSFRAFMVVVFIGTIVIMAPLLILIDPDWGYLPYQYFLNDFSEYIKPHKEHFLMFFFGGAWGLILAVQLSKKYFLGTLFMQSLRNQFYMELENSKTEEIYQRLVKTKALDDLSLGSLQVIKMWIYDQIQDGNHENEIMAQVHQKILPGLEYLEKVSEAFVAQGAEFVRENTPEARQAAHLANYFMGGGRLSKVGGSGLQSTGTVLIRILPSTLPIFYLNILMHIRLGLIDPQTDIALTVQGALNKEALFIMMPILFSSGLIPTNARFDTVAGSEAVTIADIYQSYIGSTVDPKGARRGRLLNGKTQTYFSLFQQAWILLRRELTKQARTRGETVLRIPTEQQALARTFRFQLEWLGYGALAAYGSMGEQVADERLIVAYKDIKSDLHRFYLDLKDDNGESLLDPIEIGMLLGNKAIFKSGGKPNKLRRDDVRPILEKLRQYFLDHSTTWAQFRKISVQSLEKLRSTAYAVYPEIKEPFEKAFLGPDFLKIPSNRSEMRGEDAAILSHYPLNSIIGGFKVEEVASLLGIPEAETQESLAALTRERTLIRFHVKTGIEPEQIEQSFREGKMTIDEFLEQESAFYRGQGAERFLIAGSLLHETTLAQKGRQISDEKLYQMAEALMLLLSDKLNYTLRQALGLWSSAHVYLQEEEMAGISGITERLKAINKRNQGIERDILAKKIPLNDQFKPDWKKVSRVEVVSLMREVLTELKKDIDDIHWLSTQNISGLENPLRASPVDRADALLTLMAYKKGLQTGLAQLEMVYDFYSKAMTEVASGDLAIVKDATARSEIRVGVKSKPLTTAIKDPGKSVNAVATVVTLKTEKKNSDFSDFQNRWIVLADDKPYILKGYEQILREQGFRNILSAFSPKEALNHVTGMLKQGVASNKIVVITDYQFQGKDTALDLINNLRVPTKGKVFRGPILVVSGSIVSRHEMPGYADGHLDSAMAKAYGLGYLEKNGSFYFRENFLNELHHLLKEPPNPAMFSKEKLALGKKEETKLPQQLVYLEGAINDWENATGNALRELGDLLSKENLAGGDRSAMEADLRAILGLIEFGRIPKDRNFEGRIHDYKSALHQALAIHIRSLQDRIEKIQRMNDSKTFSRSLDQLENALKGAFQNAYFLHQLFYLTRVLGRAGMWEPLLKQAIIEYQVRYEGKKDTQWDSESGIAQAWKEFERLRPGIEKAEIEQAIRDWGRLRNDYKAVQAELGSFIRERVGERGSAFLEMMSLNLNRFFELYLRQYGISGLQAVHPGRVAGKIKILRGTEDEIRQSLEGLEAGRIVVLDQDYSTLSAAGTAQTGMVFSREGAGHLATRARALGIPLVYFPDAIEMLEDGMDAILTSENGQGAILPATKEEAAFAPALKKSDRRVQPAPINENAEPVLHLYGVLNEGTYDKSSREEVFADLGPKAGRLALMYRDYEKSSALVPGSLFLTPGFWKSLREANPDKAVAIVALQNKIAMEMEETRPDLTKVRGMLEEIRNLVQAMRIPKKSRHEILTFRQQEVPANLTNQPGYKPYIPALIIRAASNVQDLENDAGVGAGVEDSNEVPENLSQEEYEKLVLMTLAGFWKWEAYADRRQWGISEEDARPLLIIQEHVGDAESYAVLIHTADPKSQDAGVVMVEFIPGSGRTLTDPAPKLQGEPFRYYFDKKTGEVISRDDSREGFHPIMATKKYTINPATNEIIPLDYRRHKDTATEKGRIALVRKIGLIAQKVEQYWGRPMDIEMVISKTNPVVPGNPDYDPNEFVYMPYTVQARPQAHFEPFVGSYQFDFEEKSRVEYWRKWTQKYGVKNIQDLGFFNDPSFEKLSGRMIPERGEAGGGFLDTIGDYRSRPGLLKTLLTTTEFELVREGILRRFFFYAKYSHQVLQDLLKDILKNDPELFQNLFVYAIPPFRFGEHLKQYPDSLAFFRNVNDFLLPRFSVGKRDAMIEVAQDLPSLSLVDLANQMDYGNQYGLGSVSFVRDECLKILAGRKDVAQVRDLLDPGLQKALGRVMDTRSEMRVDQPFLEKFPTRETKLKEIERLQDELWDAYSGVLISVGNSLAADLLRGFGEITRLGHYALIDVQGNQNKILTEYFFMRYFFSGIHRMSEMLRDEDASRHFLARQQAMRTSKKQVDKLGVEELVRHPLVFDYPAMEAAYSRREIIQTLMAAAPLRDAIDRVYPRLTDLINAIALSRGVAETQLIPIADKDRQRAVEAETALIGGDVGATPDETKAQDRASSRSEVRSVQWKLPVTKTTMDIVRLKSPLDKELAMLHKADSYGFWDFSDKLDIEPGDSVLAIGTSTDFYPGFVLAALGARVLSMDQSSYSPRLDPMETGALMSEVSVRGGAYYPLYETNYMGFPLEDSLFKVVLLFNVLDATEDPDAMLRKIFYEIAEGGFIVGSVVRDHAKFKEMLERIAGELHIEYEPMTYPQRLRSYSENLIYRIKKKPPVLSPLDVRGIENQGPKTVDQGLKVRSEVRGQISEPKDEVSPLAKIAPIPDEKLRWMRGRSIILYWQNCLRAAVADSGDVLQHVVAGWMIQTQASFTISMVRNLLTQDKYGKFMLALSALENQMASLSDYNKVSTELVPQARMFLERMAHDPRKEVLYQDIYFAEFLVSDKMTPEVSRQMAKVKALMERDKMELLGIIDYFAQRERLSTERAQVSEMVKAGHPPRSEVREATAVELSQANIPTPITHEIRPMGRISNVPTAKLWQILRLKQDVIVVVEQARIDALSPEMFKELLEIAGLNNGKLHLVIPDALQGKYSQRVAELRKVASVYYGFPQLAASEKIPVIGFSDMEHDTLTNFQRRLDPKLAGRVKDSAFGLNQAGSFGVGILYALGDVPRSELSRKNGYFYDAVGRWSTQVLEVLKAYTVISTST